MIEMSGDKFFHTGNAHTSFKSLKIYVVCGAVAQSKHVEMGQKGIKMS